jgi:hypothetical protein
MNRWISTFRRYWARSFGKGPFGLVVSEFTLVFVTCNFLSENKKLTTAWRWVKGLQQSCNNGRSRRDRLRAWLIAR